MKTWRCRCTSDNCSWFHWRSVTQLERESGFSESLSCSVLTEHAFFCTSFCSDACQCLWKSLALLSLSVTALDQIGCLKSVIADWEAGEGCFLWRWDAYLGPWGNICEWVYIGYCFLWVFYEQDDWNICLLFPCLFFHQTYQNLSILLSSSAFKEGLLSGGNKKSKFL